MSPSAEVVTDAKVRYIQVPPRGLSGERTFALITLDNGQDHTRPTTFGPQGLASLSGALDDVEGRLKSGEDIAAVCVTGKPFVFSVGADLKVFSQLKSRDEVLEIGRLGHRVFQRFGELPVPSFAFINGVALGGGLELALHCTYRTADASARAIALPEVFLGLIPGWGGCYLLPRLIGPERAVEVIVANPLNFNATLSPAKAAALGVVDAVFAPADFLEQSLRWAAEVVREDITPVRRDTVLAALDIAGWNGPFDVTLAHLDARVRGAAPAPYRAIELMRASRDATRDEAFAAEDEALADLTTSPECLASLYAFDLVNKRAKRPVGVPDVTPRAVTSVGIVGAGLMASQLAVLFARRLDVPVHMVDVDAERAEAGLGAAVAEVSRLETKKRVSHDRANRLRSRLTSGTELDALADADFVIEAVFEDLAVKRQALKAVETVVSPSTVLASNTSSLSITSLAESLQRPERFIGFHFFNPVSVMQLLEVVRGNETDDETVATSFRIAKQLKKSAVLVQDAPAFVVNRILTRLLNEIFVAIDTGTSLDVAETALNPLGLPMSPLELVDLVGPAVALHVSRTMHDAFPDRFSVSPNLERVVEANVKRFYLPAGPSEANASGGTSETNRRPVLDPAVGELLGQGDAPLTPDQLRERILGSLTDEIDTMVVDRVVADVQDIDLCLLLGAGWPFWLGGLTPYLDRTGSSRSREAGPFHHGVPQALPSR